MRYEQVEVIGGRRLRRWTISAVRLHFLLILWYQIGRFLDMVNLGDKFPNFKANTTTGTIQFHDWVGES